MLAWLGRLLLKGRSAVRARLKPDLLQLAASHTLSASGAMVVDAPRNSDDGHRRIRIESRARAIVSRLFAASQPVDNRQAMCGREDELSRLTAAICENGMHGLIYGPRGSGKTSLARVFGDYADERGLFVFYNSCAGEASFVNLMAPFLDEIGSELFELRPAEFARALATLQTDLNPRTLASFLSQIGNNDVLLILDEFDRIEDVGVKSQMAILVKLLADMRARVRLLFVGISGNVDDLIGSHASVRRHLVAVAVAPLPDDQVGDFISTTGAAAGMTFTDDARQLLRWLVRGSPYHMRLFSLQASLATLDKESRIVDGDRVTEGLRNAYDNWHMMNQRDADLFARLVGDPESPLAGLEAVAGLAASGSEITSDSLANALAGLRLPQRTVDRFLSDLAPALIRLSGKQERFMFDDVLAPQFLLAACALAGHAATAGTPGVLEGVGE